MSSSASSPPRAPTTKRPCRVATLANPTTMDTSEPAPSPAREEPPAEESVLPSPPAIDAADDEVDYGGSPDADHRRAKPADDAEESAAGDGAAAAADGAPAASKGMIPGRKENGNGGANGDARTSSVVNGMRVCDVCSKKFGVNDLKSFNSHVCGRPAGEKRPRESKEGEG